MTTRRQRALIGGVIFAVINIILSTIAYNDPAISHPQGFSDFKALSYPNVLLGLPADLISRPILIPITGAIIDPAPLPQTYTQAEFDSYVAKNDVAIHTKYAVNTFIDFFIVLTLYWFGIGYLLVYAITGRRQSRVATEQPPIT